MGALTRCRSWSAPAASGGSTTRWRSTDMTETPEEDMIWPVQDQIAAYLRDGILNGDFLPGKALPSSRKLHEKFGAAAQTIKNAMEILEREGLVYTRRGAGVFAREHRQRTMT